MPPKIAAILLNVSREWWAPQKTQTSCSSLHIIRNFLASTIKWRSHEQMIWYKNSTSFNSTYNCQKFHKTLKKRLQVFPSQRRLLKCLWSFKVARKQAIDPNYVHSTRNCTNLLQAKFAMLHKRSHSRNNNNTHPVVASDIFNPATKLHAILHRFRQQAA